MSSGKRALQAKSSLDHTGQWPCLEETFLIDSWCGKAKHTVNDDIIPRQVGLDYRRRVPEMQGREAASRQAFSVVSASVLARVLSWLPTFNGLYGLEVYGEINPFLPKSLLMVVFITAAEKPTRTGILLKVTRLSIPERALPIPGRKEVCRKEPRRSWTAKPYWVFTLYFTVRSYHFYWVGFPYRCSCFIKPTHEIDQINLLELYSTSSRSIWVSLNNNSNTTPTSNVIIKLSA